MPTLDIGWEGVMLVLTRRVGEVIVMTVEGLETPITIKVKELARSRLSLAIDADRDRVKIHKGESPHAPAQVRTPGGGDPGEAR